MSFALKCLAFGLGAVIIYLTLGPVGLRSASPFPAQIDRMGAYIVLGLLFAIAYPRRLLWVMLVLLAVAVGLEWAQNLRPDRHAEVADMIVKCVGVVLGVAGGWMALQLQNRASLRR